MKKTYIISIVFIHIYFNLFSSVLLFDYNTDLSPPSSLSPHIDTEKKQQDEQKTIFSFNIGRIDGDLSLFGYWKLKIGFGKGFSLHPSLDWSLRIKGMTDGVIFEQERVIALDYYTTSGVYLHLFFNDEIEQTEFTFRYTLNKNFKSFYITNQTEKRAISPYRDLQSGSARDINAGFNWGTRFYRGQFDVKFDSVKPVIDVFKGNRKYIENTLVSANFSRGIYYYLPDRDVFDIEIYISDINGTFFDGGFQKADEYEDYEIAYESGLVTFKTSVYMKKVLIFYKTTIGGTEYEVGDTGTGINAVQGADFNKTTNPEYFETHDGQDYLILAYNNAYSYFEEKNGYRITSPGTKMDGLSASFFSETNSPVSGFSYSYDPVTGCMRVFRSSVKGDTYNIYPFYDYDNGLYTTYITPPDSASKNYIHYSGYESSDNLKLSARPVISTIAVTLNGVPVGSGGYSYDFISNTIYLSSEIHDSDVIEVSYLAEETDALNATFVVQNDFRLNEFLLLGDSLWYKMPVKLWKDSYYFARHAAELIYNVHLTGDFRKFLIDAENGKFGFESNAAVSLYIPELKGTTILDDFEYQKTGYAVELNYKKWLPAPIPTNSVETAELSGITYGKLFFRNLHEDQVLTGSLRSIYESAPSTEGYSAGSTIGPYSSKDGFGFDTDSEKLDRNKKSLSLITDFELDSLEAVSVVIPLANSDEVKYNYFSGLTALVEALNLSGPVRLYLDAGEVSEQFESGVSTVQTETIDQGLTYFVESSFYLYKGRNDGTNSSNDLDGDGSLTGDDNSDITLFKEEESGNYYADISSGSLEVINFSIKNKSRLQKIRGLRLTIYNPGGSTVRGKLLINQLRFLESSWEYPETTNGSKAEEIFPAEDTVLMHNIFSKENETDDKKLHFQRFRERTLRVSIKQNEAFYVEKRFSPAIHINHFKKLVFYLMTEYEIDRKVKITLKDNTGTVMEHTLNLAGMAGNNWHKFALNFTDFTNWNSNTGLIDQIRFDFENEAADSRDNTLFIDEIHMDEINALAGFGSKNEFVYADPGFKIEPKGFPLFTSPSVRITNYVNTKNFVTEELNPSEYHGMNNEIITSFNFITINILLSSSFSMLFKGDTLLNPEEKLKIRLNRPSAAGVPLQFSIVYNYEKYESFPGVHKTRSLHLDAGAALKPVSFKFTYTTNNRMEEKAVITNKFNFDFAVHIRNIQTKLQFSLENSKMALSVYGPSSIENVGFLLQEDFARLFFDGYKKRQYVNWSSYFFLIPQLFYANTLRAENYGEVRHIDELSLFTTKLYVSNSLNLQTTFKGKKNTLYSVSLVRNLEDTYEGAYTGLYWDSYYYEYAAAYHKTSIIFLFPPFSSIYNNAGRRLFGSQANFKLLSDELKNTFDISHYIPEAYFTPKNLAMAFKETIASVSRYNVTYLLTFMLTSQCEFSTAVFKKAMFKHILTQTVGIKEAADSYFTKNELAINFYLYNNLDITNYIKYDTTYTDKDNVREVKHNFSFISTVFKTFYKKNYITNDKYGVETGGVLEITSLYFQRLDQVSEKNHTPVSLKLSPHVGYRFNNFLTINNTVTLGYSLEMNEAEDKKIHNFGVEVTVEGVLTF